MGRLEWDGVNARPRCDTVRRNLATAGGSETPNAIEEALGVAVAPTYVE